MVRCRDVIARLDAEVERVSAMRAAEPDREIRLRLVATAKAFASAASMLREIEGES